MKITVAAIQCVKCQSVVWSRNRHDVRYCACGSDDNGEPVGCYIDGGRDYSHIGWKDTPPLRLEIEVDESELRREPRWPY